MRINWDAINWNTVAIAAHDRVKIKSDASTYEIWGIDWLRQKVLVQRPYGDMWLPFERIEWIEKSEGTDANL